MRSLSLILLALVAVSSVQGDWEIVWQDEFDFLDTGKWNYNTGCDGFGNNELQCYVANRGENARVENGHLVIQARHENWENRQFTSAKLTSRASWKYGKFEIRARLPKGKHLWPAVWMMPQDSVYGGWPRSGELDIMEYRGQRPQQILGTAHYGPSWDNKGQVGTGERDYPLDFSQDYHTFGFLWDADGIQWILDDTQIHWESLRRNFWGGLYTADGQPFDQNFYLILNLAVGGNFFGGEPFDPIEADQWPKNTIEIDWIRVYQYK